MWIRILPIHIYSKKVSVDMEPHGFLPPLRKLLIGGARDMDDQRLFHKISLVALLAWVGLGSDGLSSSCYGPESAYLALGSHTYLSLFVALATMITITIICASYSQIIELFPSGGGGYLVASKLLSPSAGLVSGCALIVDYVLTIAISVASGTDAIFSLLPISWHVAKLVAAIAGIVFLTMLNLRGVKESVLVFLPIFAVFVITHLCGIGCAFFRHAADFPVLARNLAQDIGASHAQLGWLGVVLLVLRSYSLGAGTYTGIEAVSNGLPVLREPRVRTGKRTMALMGVSLAVMVGGLLVAYLLYQVSPVEGRTLNAVLLGDITAHWPPWLGRGFVTLSLLSAGSLLFIAAQTGFLDGPRVLANMALDRWFPTRFTSLSDRLVAQNGILLMGAVAALVTWMTRGDVAVLVVLYSINVFITFTLSQLGMVRHWWQVRKTDLRWLRKLLINGVGLVLTSGILVSLCVVKFFEGGWVTLLVTGLLITLALRIKRHYVRTHAQLGRLDNLVAVVEQSVSPDAPNVDPAKLEPAFDPQGKTAVVFVNGFNGLGLHTLFTLIRMFPGVFRNFLFVQVGVVDAGNFKGAAKMEGLKQHIHGEVNRYVNYMQRSGFHAEGLAETGIDVVTEIGNLAPGIMQRFPHAVFVGGQLVFPQDRWVDRLLHNYVVFALQRRLYQSGYPFLVLPIRV